MKVLHAFRLVLSQEFEVSSMNRAKFFLSILALFMEETSNSCGFIDLYVVFFPFLVFLREVQYALFIKIVNFVLNNIDLLLRKSKKSIDHNPIPKAKTVKKIGS